MLMTSCHTIECSGASQVEHARAMLEQAYVQKTKDIGARQRIEVVQYSTDTESVGKVVTTRAEELRADIVVSQPGSDIV